MTTVCIIWVCFIRVGATLTPRPPLPCAGEGETLLQLK